MNRIAQFTSSNLFCYADNCRTCAFLIEGEKIYVDKNILASKSAVLKTMLLNDKFIESKQDAIGLPDKSLGDMLEFFCCIFAYPEPKPISFANFSRNVELADEYQVDCILDSCQVFIDTELFVKKTTPVNMEDFLENRIFQTCIRFERFHGIVAYLVPFVARLDMNSVAPYTISFTPPVVFALWEATRRESRRHDVESTKWSSPCSICDAKTDSWCRLCSECVCASCASDPRYTVKCVAHVCGLPRSRRCPMACMFRNFDVDRLIRDLKKQP